MVWPDVRRLGRDDAAAQPPGHRQQEEPGTAPAGRAADVAMSVRKLMVATRVRHRETSVHTVWETTTWVALWLATHFTFVLGITGTGGRLGDSRLRLV